jgi:3-oxoadipate enol-lactonase
MHLRVSDGAPIWCHQAGTGDAVVLLHGLADDHRLWRHQLPVLAERWRVLAIDLRGHGRSAKRPLPSSVGRLAEDIVDVLDALGIERAAVIGLSMGGGVAQAVALARPDRVAALGLVSTSPTFPASTRQRFLQRAEIAEREGIAGLVDAMVARWFTPAFAAEHPGIVEETRLTVAANDPLAFAAACRVNASRDWVGRLGEIEVPVLFVGGSDDPAEPGAAAGLYRRHLPDVRVELVDGASHLLPLERPDVLAAHLVGIAQRAFVTG